MAAETVTATMRQALDRLSSRLPGEPRIVHDHGSQFVSAEWHRFLTSAGDTDIKTRVAHPESNGRLERLHRTHREEGLTDDDQKSYYATCEAFCLISIRAIHVHTGGGDSYGRQRCAS